MRSSLALLCALVLVFLLAQPQPSSSVNIVRLKANSRLLDTEAGPGPFKGKDQHYLDVLIRSTYQKVIDTIGTPEPTEANALLAYKTRHVARLGARAVQVAYGDLARLKQQEDRDTKLYGSPDGPSWTKTLEKYGNDWKTIIAKAKETNKAVNEAVAASRLTLTTDELAEIEKISRIEADKILKQCPPSSVNVQLTCKL